jgi:hypothetical protein
MKKTLKHAFLATLLAGLVACGPTPAYNSPAGALTGAPGTVQQHDSGMSPVTAGLLGAAAGYMLRGNGASGSQQASIVNRTTIIERRYVAPPVITTTPKFAAPKPSTFSPTPSRSFTRSGSSFSSRRR